MKYHYCRSFYEAILSLRWKASFCRMHFQDHDQYIMYARVV